MQVRKDIRIPVRMRFATIIMSQIYLLIMLKTGRNIYMI